VRDIAEQVGQGDAEDQLVDLAGRLDIGHRDLEQALADLVELFRLAPQRAAGVFLHLHALRLQVFGEGMGPDVGSGTFHVRRAVEGDLDLGLGRGGDQGDRRAGEDRVQFLFHFRSPFLSS